MAVNYKTFKKRLKELDNTDSWRSAELLLLHEHELQIMKGMILLDMAERLKIIHNEIVRQAKEDSKNLLAIAEKLETIRSDLLTSAKENK